MGSPAEDADAVLEATDRLLYRSLVEQVPAVVYIDTNELEARSPYVSPQCAEMFGRGPEEFLDDRHLWWRNIHADDLERVDREWAEALERQDRFESEYRWTKPDGSVVWVRDMVDVTTRRETGSNVGEQEQPRRGT